MQRVNLTDAWVIIVFADNQYGFCLVTHFCTNVSSHIIIPFVQMEYAMDMQVIPGRPLHHLVDNFYRFTGTVDVKHQVADTVYDDQTITFVLTQGIVYDLNAHCRSIFP